MNNVINVAYRRPKLTTIAIPLCIAFPASVENTITLIDNIVVRAVINIGRILVFPVAIRATLLSTP